MAILKEIVGNIQKVRIEFQSEAGCSREPGWVKVYANDKLVAEVTTDIELKQGADGGWYHCVTLNGKPEPNAAISAAQAATTIKDCE